jgi:hypothetical protein
MHKCLNIGACVVVVRCCGSFASRKPVGLRRLKPVLRNAKSGRKNLERSTGARLFWGSLPGALHEASSATRSDAHFGRLASPLLVAMPGTISLPVYRLAPRHTTHLIIVVCTFEAEADGYHSDDAAAAAAKAFASTPR